MRSNKSFLVLSVTFFLICLSLPYITVAQLGTIYLGAGYNNVWYRNTNIHVEQGELGNSYKMANVKGNNKTGAAFSPLMLNYRLGFYFGEFQNNGLEIAYDPYGYAIKDNQYIKTVGMLNGGLNVTRSYLFSKANGAYYRFSGANYFLVNFVRRYQLFRNNAKTVGVDALGKLGVGPAFPHFQSSLRKDPVDGPQFHFYGWNAAVEAAVKVTLYRYVYVEIAGKYDYANFQGLKMYQGTATQDLHTYGVVVTAGLTMPTMRLNPLFHKERRIITILPFYQHLDEIGRKVRKKKVKVSEDGTIDSLSVKGIQDVPEFDEILDRKYRREHPDTFQKVNDDTIKNNLFARMDTLGRLIGPDGKVLPDTAGKSGDEGLSRRALKKKRKQEAKARREAEKNPQPETPVVPGADSVGAPVPTPVVNDNPDNLSKKALKKKKKQEEEARKEQERIERERIEWERKNKEYEDLQKGTGEPEKTPEPAKEPEVKAPETKQPEVTQPEVKAPEVKAPEAEVKEPEKKEPELSKKERKRQEMAAKKEQERKDKEAKDKLEQEAKDNKAKAEASREEQLRKDREEKEKREQEAKDNKAKAEAGREEQQKKDREEKEKLEQEAKDNKAKAEAAREEQKRKDKEEKEKQDRENKEKAEAAKEERKQKEKEEKERLKQLDKENREKAKAAKEERKRKEKEGN